MTLVYQFATDVLIVVAYYEFYVAVVNARFSYRISKKLIRNKHRSSWAKLFRTGKSVSKGLFGKSIICR